LNFCAYQVCKAVQDETFSEVHALFDDNSECALRAGGRGE